MSDCNIIDTPVGWHCETHDIIYAAREGNDACPHARIARLEKVITDVAELIDDSQGVFGLHLNGDPADWESLMRGGMYEDWLGDLDDVLADMQEAKQTIKEGAGGG